MSGAYVMGGALVRLQCAVRDVLALHMGCLLCIRKSATNMGCHFREAETVHDRMMSGALDDTVMGGMSWTLANASRVGMAPGCQAAALDAAVNNRVCRPEGSTFCLSCVRSMHWQCSFRAQLSRVRPLISAAALLHCRRPPSSRGTQSGWGTASTQT